MDLSQFTALLQGLADALGLDYLWLKYIHILSATLLFGTGLGTAFHMYASHRSADVRAIAVASRNTVIADWTFTAPAVVVQPISGTLLAAVAGYPLDSGWILVSLALYCVAGACWLPVVWLQTRMYHLARAAVASNAALPPTYYRAQRLWFWLGWPAFGSVLVIYFLMLARSV
ncbi:MAG: DUF2269 family protein [Azospirillum sp.]|nr:DUF2269 family protein [Azospirillum sp.]